MLGIGMINEKWTPKIKKWLEEGKDDAEDIIDIPWDIVLEETEKSDYIKASLPSIPFTIDIHVGEEFIGLYLDMKYFTDVLEVKEKMRLYKKLLVMNRDFNTMKTTLSGDQDSIVVCVDIDLASLNKTEFSNALTSLVMGSTQVIKILDMGDEIYKYMMARTMRSISEMHKGGKTKETIKDYLLHRVGVDEEMAAAMLSQLHEPAPAEKVEGKEHPADRYIG
jgi:hypothetical protein